jgi:hypothetical protein
LLDTFRPGRTGAAAIAVPLGHIDFAILRDFDFGRMIEGFVSVGNMALAD